MPGTDVIYWTVSKQVRSKHAGYVGRWMCFVLEDYSEAGGANPWCLTNRLPGMLGSSLHPTRDAAEIAACRAWSEWVRGTKNYRPRNAV